MGLIPCPECGRRISELAPACPQCGHPNPVYLPPEGARAAPRQGDGSGITILVLGALGFLGMVFVVGILAAIAIPRFASVAGQAQTAGAEAEAATTLASLRDLQAAHRERHGAYAAEISALEEAGVVDPQSGYYEYSVSEATDTDLCLDAVPSAAGEAAGVEPLSMDEAGTHYIGAGCDPAMAIDAESLSEDPAAADPETATDPATSDDPAVTEDFEPEPDPAPPSTAIAES